MAAVEKFPRASSRFRAPFGSGLVGLRLDRPPIRKWRKQTSIPLPWGLSIRNEPKFLGEHSPCAEKRSAHSKKKLPMQGHS
jgi:hypothetical protein